MLRDPVQEKQITDGLNDIFTKHYDLITDDITKAEVSIVDASIIADELLRNNRSDDMEKLANTLDDFIHRPPVTSSHLEEMRAEVLDFVMDLVRKEQERWTVGQLSY